MIKRLTRGAIIAIAAVMLLLPFYKAQAGIPVGTWRSHPAYNNATYALNAFGKIFVISEGALYFYDPADEAIYTIDKTGGLSDTEIAMMAYCNTEKAVILAYSNGNIDILYEDETIYNFTDIKNNSIGNASVNEIKVYGDKAYISTDIGLIVFDVKKREISNSYKFDSPVHTSIILHDSILCSSNAGIYLGNLNDNLLDSSNWKMFLPRKFIDLFEFDGLLMGRSYNNIIRTINRKNGKLVDIKNNVNGISYINNNLALIQDTVLTVFTTIENSEDYHFPNHLDHVLSVGNDIWICEGTKGLCLYTISDNEFVCKLHDIKPNSPRRNWFHSVSWPETDKMLVVGGCHNYSGINYEGTVMTYKDGRWNYLQDNLNEITGLNYINLTEAAQDPHDNSHIFVGSTGQGLYEFKNDKFYKLHTWNNSGLTSILNDNEYNKYNYVRISALQYDSKGNLWMANNETDTIIKVMEPDGNWFGLYYKDIAGLPTFKQLRFHGSNKVWLNSSRYVPGIVCIDTKGTIKDNSDDSFRFSGPFFKNQDEKTEEIDDIYFYEFDMNGILWIGTNRGIFILKDPDNFINDNNPVFERIKIPRNDGSGLADYLFSEVITTAIYIDQGNRKWIGTVDDGVFLMSADGTKTLEHFTTSNSPLPSNYIMSITENVDNGSIFFGTELGMVEYGGQARDPEENLSKSNILVYPNPVKPEFEGYVTITGLTQWSTIRITSNSGHLIHQGISNGGSYSWNLTDMNGHKVTSGIYHAVITNQESNKSESVSITVIR